MLSDLNLPDQRVERILALLAQTLSSSLVHRGLQPKTTSAVLRIRDVYLGSRIRIFFHPRIPDPNFSIFSISDPGSPSKNLSILTQKIGSGS